MVHTAPGVPEYSWIDIITYSHIFHHLLTLGHRVELGLQLLLDGADLPGPLLAVLLCHIPTLEETWMNTRTNKEDDS